MISAAELDAVVAEIAGPLLVAAGFAHVDRRKWVRSREPVRHVFEIVAFKGFSVVPRWGVSLDFVPHIKGASLAWHRSEKSAQCDLVYDPVDFYADWQRSWAISSWQADDDLRRDAARVISAAVTAACAMLDDVRDEAAVMKLAEWLRTAERPGGRFKFENWTQQPLAYAFLLARSGSQQVALEIVEKWLERRHGDTPIALANKVRTLLVARCSPAT